MKLILASQSPWRKTLLSWLEVPFEVVESGFDEKSVSITDPEELVATLALSKVEVVARSLDEGLVIGADTVVVIDGKPMGDLRILGKPKDEVHAREILQRLRGSEHTVYTGVAVVDVVTGEKRVEVDVTTVCFKDFSDAVLEQFLQSGEWEGKAGAYQILSIMDKLMVESVQGSVTGVIGLPLKRLVGMLEEMGVAIEVDSEAVVWEKIGYRD